MATRVTTAILDDVPAATCSDFQGHRLAVGTGSGAVSTFDRAPGDRGWQTSATWAAHDTAVTQVAAAFDCPAVISGVNWGARQQRMCIKSNSGRTSALNVRLSHEAGE